MVAAPGKLQTQLATEQNMTLEFMWTTGAVSVWASTPLLDGGPTKCLSLRRAKLRHGRCHTDVMELVATNHVFETGRGFRSPETFYRNRARVRYEKCILRYLIFPTQKQKIKEPTNGHDYEPVWSTSHAHILSPPKNALLYRPHFSWFSKWTFSKKPRQ